MFDHKMNKNSMWVKCLPSKHATPVGLTPTLEQAVIKIGIAGNAGLQ